MFDDEGASIAAPQLFSSFHFPSKASFSRPFFDFGLSSTFSEPVDEEIQLDDQVQMHIEAETESTPKQVNADTTHPGPSEQPANLDDDKNKSRTSTSDTGSSAGNYVDPFALLELQYNIYDTMKKVDA